MRAQPAGYRAEIDVEAGSTVIEVKRDLRKQKTKSEAEDQLAGYVDAVAMPGNRGGLGGWGSDENKKVNSYPMTSEDDQSGRLTPVPYKTPGDIRDMDTAEGLRLMDRVAEFVRLRPTRALVGGVFSRALGNHVGRCQVFCVN